MRVTGRARKMTAALVAGAVALLLPLSGTAAAADGSPSPSADATPLEKVNALV